MSAEIKDLSPKHVWGYFYDLTQIPRPTGHMEAVTRFMISFGKGLGLETLQDEVGNVLIRKPATPGMAPMVGTSRSNTIFLIRLVSSKYWCWKRWVGSSE